MKARTVVPRARASQDVDDIIRYYLGEDAEQAALGFIDTLERAYRHIARHPEYGSSRHAHELDLPGLRTWALKRFPYLIFYIEREDSIDVWRVLHEARDIPQWMQDSTPSDID